MANAPKSERVVFVRQAAERISKVVRTVESGQRDGTALHFGSAGVASSKTFRVCTFTGVWAIGSLKTVTFKDQTSTPNTVTVVNLFCGMSPNAACDVSVAKSGTAWYVVQPNLTQLPGYSGTGTHVLAVVGGVLRWLGTTACT